MFRRKAVLAYGIILVMLLFLAGCSSSPASNTSTPAPATQTASINWAQAPVTQDTVTTELKQFKSSDFMGVEDDNFPMDATQVTVTDSAIQVEYKPAGGDDETLFINRAIGTDLDAMELLFQNKQVASIDMITMVDMVDQTGNTSTEQGFELKYDSSTDAKIDWNGFKNRVVADPVDALNVSNYYLINLGIYKNLKAPFDALTAPSGGTANS